MQFDSPRADELPLVYDAWARSFRKSPWAGCVRNCDWDQVSRATIEEILNRGARVTVAVQELEDGGRRVAGYSVSEPHAGVLHWLFVKKAFRGMGIGRDLLRETLLDFPQRTPVYTHRTTASSRFLGPGWTHDPAPARVKP
jgi:ribosomal protein S18 acetylase RimI-like enzyme